MLETIEGLPVWQTLDRDLGWEGVVRKTRLISFLNQCGARLSRTHRKRHYLNFADVILKYV